MSDIERSSLFEKLNKIGYKSLEGATVFCKLRNNPYVELVHWFKQMLQFDNSDPVLYRQTFRDRSRAPYSRYYCSTGSFCLVEQAPFPIYHIELTN